MSQFTNFDISTVKFSPYASAKTGNSLYIVTQPFSYWVGKESDDVSVIIPLGYLTDGASVPKFFQRWISPWDKHGQAAIVHDYLCETLIVKVHGKTQTITRKQADLIFLEACKILKVSRWLRTVLYFAVRYNSIFNAHGKAVKSNHREKLRFELLSYHYKNKSWDKP